MATGTCKQFLCIFLPPHTSRGSLEQVLYKFLSLPPLPDIKILIQDLSLNLPLWAVNKADLKTKAALQELMAATQRYASKLSDHSVTGLGERQCV